MTLIDGILDIHQPDEAEIETLCSLLSASALPVEGVRQHRAGFLVAVKEGRLIGGIGLELYGETALLRSAVVDPDERSTGLGRMLIKEITSLARRSGVKNLVLLTTTAAGYFHRMGFSAVDRASVTGPVTGSWEFSGGCCATAVCMTKELHA